MWSPLLFLLLASPSFASALPCEDRFAQLMQPKTGATWAAPGKIKVPLTSHQAIDSFRLALLAWQKNVDLEKFRKTLRRIENDPYSGEEYFNSLKRARKFASILRSHYLLLSQGNVVPADLEAFTKTLGHLNDAIANRAGKREIQELVRATHAASTNLPAALTADSFRPASLPSLRERLDEIRATITDITGETLPTPHSFHLARKAAKELLAYYQSRAALFPNPKNDRTFGFLFQLNEDMGVIHDEFVSQARAGTLDYERQRFFLPPPIKSKLQKLEAALAGD